MRTIYSIHPAIGIARIGDSGYTQGAEWDRNNMASYFIGPEAPGPQFVPQSYTHDDSGDGLGKYRNENDHKIRRQGARFRIYSKVIDDNGEVVSATEITTAEAKITWTVSLANRKAAGERFPPYHKAVLNELANHPLPDGSGNYPNMVMRNYEIIGDERNNLIIADSGEIDGVSGDVETLQGQFLGSEVKLADVLTDEHGRLIVLGGHGISKSPRNLPWVEPQILGTVRENNALPKHIQRQGSRHRLYNWDGWCDDTSDGKISASVVLNGESQAVPVEDAWVVVAPPDHAAAARSPVTLYDVAYSTVRTARKEGGLPVPALTVFFTRDVYPVLRRTVDLQYVSDRVRLGHSGDAAGNFTDAEIMARLSSKADWYQTEKVMFLERLTRAGAIGDKIDMPDLYGGVSPIDPERPPPSEALDNSLSDRRDFYGVPLTMTDYQFEVLGAWANHDFDDDWPGHAPTYPSLDSIEPEKQPAALDKAALEQCNGGSFHPGIEVSFIAGRSDTYRIQADSWFRLADGVEPGHLTENLALPWQLDFAACSELWWPGQRPVSVPVRETDGTIAYKDWQVSTADAQKLLSTLANAGFVRFHPEDGEIYLDDAAEETIRELLNTGTPEALDVREWLSRIRVEGFVPPN